MVQPANRRFVTEGALDDPASPARVSLDSIFVKGSVRAAGGATTAGSLIKIGPEAAFPSDIGTSGIVGGGAPNYENVIGGIIANVDTPTSNIPAGGAGTGAGDLTAPDGNWNWIWGGYDNVVNGWACQVQAYHSKIETGANHVTISGGSIHVADVDCAYGTVGGGTQNRVGGNVPTIAGGEQNTALGNYSAIGGGQLNTAPGASAVVSGGSSNDATGSNSTVSGGTGNDATGASSAVLGGQFNVASGTATVVMGRENTASGPAAVAMGRDALSSYHGGVAHSAGKFAAQGDAQRMSLQVRGETTDATPKVLLLDNISSRMVLPEQTTWAFKGTVVARRTDADNESAGYEIAGVIDRQTTSASTTAMVGTPTVTVLAEDIAAWNVTVGASTSFGSLDITVTGEAAKTIRWVAHIEIVQVSG